ncbi:MAG: glutathione peroxidase [Lysobacterales bacterium]
MQSLLSLLLLAASGQSCELLDHNFRKLASEDSVNLCETYQGDVVLIVNTASKCGNTPQYDGLEAMNEKYADRGFAVLGFPSNDFMGQEPGTEEQIEEFCRLTYGVKFPMFEKTLVKGEQAHPFFQQLAELDQAPTWNFQKYLIGRDGKLIQAFSPRTQPSDPALAAAIEAALTK